MNQSAAYLRIKNQNKTSARRVGRRVYGVRNSCSLFFARDREVIYAAKYIRGIMQPSCM